jgi:hypothetical protein
MKKCNSPRSVDGVPTLDRGAVRISALSEESDEKEYYFALKPAERLNAIEMNRRMVYGKDRVAQRLQRFLEVAELARS